MAQRHGIYLVLAMAGLASCVSREPFVIDVDYTRQGASQCSLSVADVPMTLEQISELAGRRLAHRRVIIRAKQSDVPYRCVGALIYTLQSSGVQRIDFDLPRP